jgi:fatty acid-binding protein 3
VAVATSPTIDISVKDDGTYVVSTTSTFKSSTIEFKLGEPFDEKRMDGQTVKTVVTKEGNKLIQKQDSKPPVEIIREFVGDKMITTCKCGDVVNVREYKKVN